MGLLRLTGSPTLALIPGCLLSGAMAARFVVALLALASLCAASDLDCKELVKPLVLDSHSPVSMTIGRQAGRTVGGWVSQLCGRFPLSLSDLREVGAPRGVVGQARPEE